MIIGISGKINSGKDLTGRIIKILLESPQLTPKGVMTFLERGLYNNSGEWQIKKFADKLKDIVCLLIGCTREQLEDREFKEKELGEEWWYIKHWYPANPNKDRVATLYPYIGFDSRMFDGDDCCMWEIIKTTPRLLLQLIGTECGRQIIHPNIWVNALMSDYKGIHYGVGLDPFASNEENLKKVTHIKYPNWIITDMRFPNELEAVEIRGGVTIRINRNPEDKWIDKQEWDLHTKGIVPHESETALDNYEKFTYVIENNNTIEELIQKVKEILITEKLI